jgi:putative hemolysin
MEIITLGILILINGFFSLSEISLVSSKRVKHERARAEGSKGAHVAIKLLDRSENFLSAIQVGITLIGIVTGVYGSTTRATSLKSLILTGAGLTRF